MRFALHHSPRLHSLAAPRRAKTWSVGLCAVAMAGLSTVAQAVDSPAAASRTPGTAGIDSTGTASEPRSVERIVRALRNTQRDGIWMPTALRAPEDFKTLQQDIDTQRPKAVAAVLQATRAVQTDRATAQSALDALALGKPDAAVELLAGLERTAEQAGTRKAAAALARHQGVLLAGTDVEKALQAFQRASRLEATDTQTLLVINDLNSYLQASVPSAGVSQLGNTGSLALATSDALIAGRTRIQELVLSGNAQLQARDMPAALASFRAAVQMGEQLVAAGTPGADTSDELRRDLSIAHNRVGDALLAQGSTPEALAAFRQALTLRERLAAAPNAPVQAQRDLMQSLMRVASAQQRAGRNDDAAQTLERASSLAQRVVRQQPELLDAQRDLATSLEQLGDLRLQAGSLAPAKTVLTQALGLRQAIAGRDASNRTWQRELASSLDLSGELLQTQKDAAGALSASKRSLALRLSLLGADPENAQLLRDVSVGQNRLGDLLANQGNRGEAVAAYREAVRIREGLLTREPNNSQWQRDLSVSQAKLGDTLALQGDQTAARNALQAALDLREALASQDSGNSQWQSDLALALGKLSTLQNVSMADRQAYLQRGQAILDTLKARGQLGSQQTWTAWFDAQKRLLERPSLERTGARGDTALAPASPRLR